MNRKLMMYEDYQCKPREIYLGTYWNWIIYSAYNQGWGYHYGVREYEKM